MDDFDAKIDEIVADELARTDEAGEMAVAASRESVRDLKKVFCDHWDTARKVLEFLKPYLPAVLRVPLTVLIRIGDRIHSTICPT
ncbi:MAG: hypothetical protein QNJ15_13310 [Erythrobacter sp.]|nr:hypothetical protein [Erythrobacter sp.]